MILSELNSIKRLGIFFFFDEDGIVDKYVTHLLSDMRKHVTELLVVCNGKLTSEGRKQFDLFADQLIVRENKGFDVWAYKEGMNYYGWNKIAKFDEVVLFNATIFGPIDSFKEMFDNMNQRDLDFWGITLHHKLSYDPFGTIKYGYIPKHLQSHFIVIRKPMLGSYEFQKYWDNMVQINSYNESVGIHESIFTKEFEDKGFKWAAYVDTEDMEELTYYPLVLTPLELIKKYKCPIIKRRNFFQEYDFVLDNQLGEATLEMFEYLQKNTNYDVDMIWENLLRSYHQSDIKKALQLNYILPTDLSKSISKGIKVALILHIYFEDLIDETYRYAQSAEHVADIYVTTDTLEKKKKIEEKFRSLKCNKLEIIIIENRGRDVSSLLVGSKSFVMDYDYVCFAHDKKTGQVSPATIGQSFAYKCFENILHNKELVNNIIATFEENPRLGLLTPPPPNHADFYPTIGFEWGYNYHLMEQLVEKLDLKVPMSFYKEPIAPLGTMFWFRTKAMKALFDVDWEYKDFPKEPNNTDGTILHAIERIYPFVVQHHRFYPAWVLSDRFAKIELTNLNYMLRKINVAYFEKYGFTNHYGLVSSIEQNVRLQSRTFLKLKEKLRKILPASVFNLFKKVWHKLKRS